MSMMEQFPADFSVDPSKSRALLLRAASPVARYRRYWRLLLPALAAIWLAPAIYMIAAPNRYTSSFSLILPGSGSGSSLTLDSIGQAQSNSSSAFASQTLSPTENYRLLLTADVTRADAAHLAHLADNAFPMPQVKLVDQTNLIQVAVGGHTAREAQANARALRQAFLDQLDRLRDDEATKRAASDLAHLQELSAKEQAAQRKLIAFQASHGLASMEQFNARIADLDAMKDKERELRLLLRTHQGEAASLSGSLHAGTSQANLAMRLRGDPVFEKLADSYAASNADAETKSATLGPQHGAMAEANAERDRLRAALVKRGAEITGLPAAALLDATDLALAEGRNALMQTMTVGAAEAQGTAGALAELHGDLDRARAGSPALVADASQLADLQRDARVAAAVFSSALARLDTNRLDPFASYPLVQTLAEPSLPARKTSPSLALALAGALAGTLALMIGTGLAWARRPLLDRIRPRG